MATVKIISNLMDYEALFILKQGLIKTFFNWGVRKEHKPSHGRSAAVAAALPVLTGQLTARRDLLTLPAEVVRQRRLAGRGGHQGGAGGLLPPAGSGGPGVLSAAL